MANFFGNSDPNRSERDTLNMKYSRSRTSLLTVVILTAINIVLLITNSNLYFLFSAFVPYLIADLGMALCGKYPEEYYTDELSDIEFFEPSFLIVMAVIAFCVLGIYLLCWLMSKEHKGGWLIFALVLFSIDTLAMLTSIGLAFEFVIDFLFHVWVIFDLVSGIRANNKLKFLAEEAPFSPYMPQYPPNIGQMPENGQYYDTSASPYAQNSFTPESERPETFTPPVYPDSPILRVADMTVKHRILLDASVGDLYICYRRVKSVNELVINGNVYAERKGVIEFSHSLNAFVHGQAVEAGLEGSYSYIKVNGELIERKMRLV